MKRLAWLLLALAVVACGEAAAEETATIEVFSPQGTVKGVRQVAVRFSHQMVAFGDPRLPDPFDIECPEPGVARWADARNWVYDFERDLPAGVACRFTPKHALRTLEGKPMTGKESYAFDTGGPAIRKAFPAEGAQADENQAFILALDADATPSSIEQSARCEIEGLSERIGVTVVMSDERDRILAQRQSLGYEYFQILFKSGRQEVVGVADRSQAEQVLTIVRCRRTLPPGAKMRLVWGAGIATPSGVATSRDQVLPFRVRPAFTARLECERVNPRAPCLPMRPIRVVFSAPVPKELVARIRLAGKDRDFPLAGLDEVKTPTVEEIGFAGPFPEHGTLTLEIPGDIRDDAGRPLVNATRFPLQVRTDEYPPLAKFPAVFGIIELKAGAGLPVTLRNVEATVQMRQLRVAAPESEEADAPVPPAVSAPPDAAGSIPGKMQRLIEDDREIIRWLKRVEQHSEPSFEREEIEETAGAATLAEGDQTAEEDADTATDSPRWRYRNLTGTRSVFEEGSPATVFHLPKPHGSQAFEVVGIPLKEPGFYVIELASPRLGAALLGEARPRYVQTAALVTNLAAHLKWGRESSVVWVTALDTAAPVPGAAIAVRNCTGHAHWQGKTGKDGLAHIPHGAIPEPGQAPHCSDGWGQSLFVSARTKHDMTFVRSNWSRGIAASDFNLPRGGHRDPYIAHTVFARTLLRAGDTVHMKHFFRQQTMAGFSVPEESSLPDHLIITHQGSGQRYELPLRFGPAGLAESEWQAPKEAKPGVYGVAYGGKSKYTTYAAGSFRVEAFRVPTMKAVIQPPKEALVNARETFADLLVTYLSGGGAAYAPVKLRTMVQPRALRFLDYPDFLFGGEEIKEGIDTERPWWLFSVGESPDAAERSPKEAPAQVLPLSLDGAGAARVAIPNLPRVVQPKDLLLELEYQDANGELLTASTRAALWPAMINLGLRTEGWVGTKDRLRFQVVALDLAGKPVPKQAITVELYRKIRYSHRKRLIGGFYAYETVVEHRRAGDACAGNADEHGLLLCEIAPNVSGEVVLIARTTDSAGNAAVASRSTWIVSGEEWWFEGTGSDRMDVLPEKKHYEAGDTARFQVRMPFRNATVLVTVEREGVIEAFVRELSGKEPVLEVPIKPNYAPNVFVSVLAVRGRVQEPAPTALIDLGKPAFRLGLASLNVGWAPHTLKVAVDPDAQVYAARGTVQTKIRVARADGRRLPEGAQVAIAAVDEGLLELMPNNSWNLLEHMMRSRGIEVATATAQMEVVGKRHYGRKAVPQGGGGGRQAARELFDTLLFWKGQVPLDSNGEATVSIPLNDSLTSFRIVAIANAGVDLFGTGQASIRTTQDLMLHSGLPPLVREGDHFRGTVTVRNTSVRAMTVNVAARLSGESGRPLAVRKQPARQRVTLRAGEAREIGWDVVAPIDSHKLQWEVSARERAGVGADTLRVKQTVMAAYPVRTFQATLLQLDQPLRLDAEIPADAVRGRGGVNVVVRAKLADNLSGVVEFMSSYHYNCYEQWISQAIALRSAERWEHAMALLPDYLDRDGLLKYFASEWLEGSDVLTAYVMAVAHEAGWTVPARSRLAMFKALKGFIAGRIVRGSPVPTMDLSIRKLAAIEALSRYGEASADMLSAISIDPNLWPTSAVLDWLQILKRIDGIPERERRMLEAQQIIRSRLNFQGTTLGFSTERSDALWWLMISTDVNAARVVLALRDEPAWRADIPRLVRGALGRQQRGHWNTTVANAWGVLAMEKFGQAFEATPVSGQTVARLGAAHQMLDWQTSDAGGAVDLPWPPGRAPLTVTHEGAGKPWVTVQSRAAIPLKAALSSGFTIRRTVTAVERKRQGVWSRGDVARITLELEAQSDMSWVVVEDPIPAGASFLGTGLGRDSKVLTQGQRRTGWAWLAFEERQFDTFRAYYAFVPKGKWSLQYTLRLNNPGTFQLPATRVEAMYAPEMFGELPNDRVVVTRGQ